MHSRFLVFVPTTRHILGTALQETLPPTIALASAIVKKKKKAGVELLVSYSQEDFVFVKHDEDNNHSHPPIPGTETQI